MRGGGLMGILTIAMKQSKNPFLIKLPLVRTHVSSSFAKRSEITISNRTDGYISSLIIEMDLGFTNVSTYSVSSKI